MGISNVLLDDIFKIKEFIKITPNYSVDISAVRGNYVVNAKSLLGLLSLNLTEPIEIRIKTDDLNLYNQLNSELKKFIVA